MSGAVEARTAAAPKARRAAAFVCAVLGAALVILATAVACIEAVAFDQKFYAAEYQKLGAADYVGVDGPTLFEGTGVLLEYLQGERDSLDLPVTIDGQRQEYYNGREKAHMVDVRALNENAARFMIAGYIAGAALVAAAYFISKNARQTLRGCFWGILAVLAVFAALGVWAAADFGAFWVSFHHVFFTNDLWLLDPATSRMIRMFQQAFFFDMVTKILAWFLGISAAALAATGIGSKVLRKRGAAV